MGVAWGASPGKYQRAHFWCKFTRGLLEAKAEASDDKNFSTVYHQHCLELELFNISPKQKSHDRSISWFQSKFGKSAFFNPPLCKKKTFNILFLMSHGGPFHRGSKLAKSQKSVPHHLCASVTMSLKALTEKNYYCTISSLL